MKSFLKEFRLEITILILALVGSFFLFEPFGIRAIIRKTVRTSAATGLTITQSILDRLIAILFNISIIDIVGWILIIGAVAFVVARIRYRYRKNPENKATVCPNCGDRIYRVHRSQFDRLLGKTLLPNSHRYQCTNPDCGWSGLRRPNHRSERSVPEGDVSQAR